MIVGIILIATKTAAKMRINRRRHGRIWIRDIIPVRRIDDEGQVGSVKCCASCTISFLFFLFLFIFLLIRIWACFI